MVATFVPTGILPAQNSPSAAAIDAYIRPYVLTNNFSGQLLVARGGSLIYRRNFGLLDREHNDPVTGPTKFHIASVSMQLTAAAVMRLVYRHLLSLDTRVSEVVPWVRDGDKITIRNLLEQRSGLADINSRSDYDEILTRHQTPEALVRFISGDTLLFTPGTKYLHEEHSAANLLALIIERKTGLEFSRAMQRLLFKPAGMRHSAADNDSSCAKEAARGYEPRGIDELAAARSIHWSAKAGNASVCTTADDLASWIHQLFHGHLLSSVSQALITDSASAPIGYGWFRRRSDRFHEFTYYMNGRSPGFASFVLYLPREDITVIALSNIYSSATTEIGNEIAAIALGLPYKPLAFKLPLLAPDSLGIAGMKFKFGGDFYQSNATLTFVQKSSGMFLVWPSGDESPLIPIDGDHLIDRGYWEPVNIARDSAGRPTTITYDRFTGTRVEPPPLP